MDSFRFALLFACSSLIACSSSSSPSGSSGSGDAGSDSDAEPPKNRCGPAAMEPGTCGLALQACTIVQASHVTAPPTWLTNPPAGGDHVAVWAAWGAHTKVVPRGNWVHNLEHGGVAFLYRCPSREACPDLAAKLEALAAAVTPDNSCAPVRRVLVTPDPLLPEGVQVAASSWGFALTAKCFDEAAFREFFTAHVGHGPENICTDGAFTD